jgi:hypothetical protein
MLSIAVPITRRFTMNEAHAMTRATAALSRMPIILSAASTITPEQESRTTWLSSAAKALPM